MVGSCPGAPGGMADSLDHGAVPFPALVRELEDCAFAGIPPVFQVGVHELRRRGWREARIVARARATVSTRRASTNWCWRCSSIGTIIRSTSNTTLSLFDEATIDRMLDHYVALAAGVIANPAAALGDYTLLDAAEHDTIVRTWNATQADYPQDLCVHELFAEQARRTPDAVAVRCGEASLTYRELDRRSNALAGYLRRRGVKPDGLVGICVERSLEMMVGLLGIFKAGGAYVPLDPSHPVERLQYILDDSAVSLIVTQAGQLDKLGALAGPRRAMVVLGRDWNEIETQSVEDNEGPAGAGPGHLAYVIYTSGSTGDPKGVMIPHRALTNSVDVDGGQGAGIEQRRPAAGGDDPSLRYRRASNCSCRSLAGAQLPHLCDAAWPSDVEKLKREIGRSGRRSCRRRLRRGACCPLGLAQRGRGRIVCGGEALSEGLRAGIVATGCEAVEHVRADRDHDVVDGAADRGRWSHHDRAADRQYADLYCRRSASAGAGRGCR